MYTSRRSFAQDLAVYKFTWLTYNPFDRRSRSLYTVITITASHDSHLRGVGNSNIKST